MKKTGFSLTEIMVFLLASSIVIGITAPAFTKRKVAPKLNIPHGTFSCVRTDNKLTQTLTQNGATVVSENLSKCTFMPPAKARFFVITLVGAGSGGKSAQVKRDTEISDTQYYNFACGTQFTNPFSIMNNLAGCSGGTCSDSTFASFVGNLNYKIYGGGGGNTRGIDHGEGCQSEGRNGAAGGGCSVNLQLKVGQTIECASGNAGILGDKYAEDGTQGGSGYLRFNGANYTATGGKGSYWVTRSESEKRWIGTGGKSCYTDLQKIARTSTDAGSCSNVNNRITGPGSASETSPSTPSSKSWKIQEWKQITYSPGAGGNQGDVALWETSQLNSANTLVINLNDIGRGGESDKAGGETTVAAYRVAGGAIPTNTGDSIEPLNVYSSSPEIYGSIIKSGKDGDPSRYDVVNLGGRGKAGTCGEVSRTNRAKDYTCNGLNGTNIGSGGGGGGLVYYHRNAYRVGTWNNAQYGKNGNDTSKDVAVKGKGGRGGDGAVFIAW